MAASRTTSILRTSATTLLIASAPVAFAQAPSPTPSASPQPAPSPAQAGPPVNTIKEAFQRFSNCWKPPAASVAAPMDITAIVSFNRSGVIMGRPRITYESKTATDGDRLAYRVAVMEALQRCTPMPFTETMAGAVAGHPFAIQFRTQPREQEKKAWLSPKIL